MVSDDVIEIVHEHIALSLLSVGPAGTFDEGVRSTTTPETKTESVDCLRVDDENMGRCCRKKNVNEPPPPPKGKKDDEKEKAAPAGSWLQHEDKDKKNNAILWRNNDSGERSYRLYYLPWDAPPQPADEHKYRKESPIVEMTGKPKKVPVGSWLQHKRDDGHLCWRNNHTGEYARKIWFSRDGLSSSLSSSDPRIIVEARFVATLKEPSSEDKPTMEGSAAAAAAASSKHFIARSHEWEELFHEICGTKTWRHRETGDIKIKDPLR